jgi:Ca2+-binding RTX toxin-like protein
VTVGGTFTYTPPAGTLLPAGTQTLSAKFTPSDSTDYTTATAKVQIVVLGPGVTVIGSQLYCVGGTTKNDQIQVNPVGSSSTGSTGVKVQASLNGVNTQTTYSQSFTTINVFLQGGNENIQLANSLTINAVVTAGNGNDNVTVGNGNNIVTVGNGNDDIQAGSGSNTVMAGDGNDYVQLGDGNDNVVVGNGNDNVQLGNGSDVIVEGNGNDNVSAGDGSDLVVGGLGQHTIQLGNGKDILIDGSATIVNSGDSLRQILSDWNTSPSASVDSRLNVVYNMSDPNVLKAGSGRDWFFFKYSKDVTNKKSTDRVN